MKRENNRAEVSFKGCRMGETNHLPEFLVTPGSFRRGVWSGGCRIGSVLKVRLVVTLMEMESGFLRLWTPENEADALLRRVFLSPGELVFTPWDGDGNPFYFSIARLLPEVPESAENGKVSVKFEVYPNASGYYVERHRW